MLPPRLSADDVYTPPPRYASATTPPPMLQDAIAAADVLPTAAAADFTSMPAMLFMMRLPRLIYFVGVTPSIRRHGALYAPMPLR